VRFYIIFSVNFIRISFSLLVESITIESIDRPVHIRNIVKFLARPDSIVARFKNFANEGVRGISIVILFCRAERRVTYYRCLAHIPRTLATVADSYRLVYTISALRLLERWNPGRHDKEDRSKRVYTMFVPTAYVFFICYDAQATMNVVDKK